jgi:succinate-semialdehyde dehydrogenase/glutarate-semialdehyde dehydrogenase
VTSPCSFYIDGTWCDAQGGRTLAVEDPATGEVIAQVADAAPIDGDSALAAAAAAFWRWRHVSARHRAEALINAYQLMMQRREELSLIMTLEMGKPLSESRGKVSYAAGFLRWYAEEAVRINGRISTSETGPAGC